MKCCLSKECPPGLPTGLSGQSEHLLDISTLVQGLCAALKSSSLGEDKLCLVLFWVCGEMEDGAACSEELLEPRWLTLHLVLIAMAPAAT